MDFKKSSNKKKQKNIDSVSKKTTNKIGLTILKIIFFSFLLLITVGAAIGLGVGKAIIDSAPEITIDDVKPEGYTTIIYDQNGNEIQQLHGEEANRIYVEFDQIPDHFKDAIVSIEDERFWQHNGIDLKGILRAIVTNIKAGDLTQSGASTITQQLIKNNVLSTEKKFKRKIQEQYLAIKLEQELSKEKILEYYMNTANFGRGAYGVQSAALTYFNKDVSELTIAESAVIAGITQLPGYYEPVTNPENNRERQLTVLNKMLELGKITEEEYEEAVNEDVYSHIQIVNQQFVEEQSDYSYFVDEVILRVLNDLKVKKGYTENQAKNLVYRGGLSIFITQDLEMQEIVDNVFATEEYYPPTYETYAVRLLYTLSLETPDGDTIHKYKEAEFDTDEEAIAYKEELKAEWLGTENKLLDERALYIPQPQAAMVIMDYHTGHVKAIAGGRGEKIGNLTFNRATQALRQPGSTFKVLAAYLPAIDTAGYTLGTVIDDVPFEVILGDGSTYSPKNWYDGWPYNYRGLSTVREGIRDSMNILAVKTLFDVGIQTGFDYLEKLGFTTLIDEPDSNGKTDKGLALALGGITKGVSPLELTAAYGAIANKGVYTEPIFYTKILDHDGAILLTNEPTTRTVMKETTAFLLTSAMKDVITSGTGQLANFKTMPIAGKTGTSQDDVDLVFSGYTPYYVGTVWMGYDQNKKMRYSKSYHNIIWRDVMQKIHENLPYKDFETPSGIVGATICTESGKLAVEGLCDHDPRGSTTRYEYFTTSTVPTETCDVHVKVSICNDSHLFATEYCPEDSVEEKIMISRPEPLIPENWDPANPPRIEDFQYELPASMAGEYCNIHGPAFELPEIRLPGENDDDDDDDDDDDNNDNDDDDDNENSNIFRFFPGPDIDFDN